MTKVLVIAAHADDEALGCGGTMAKHSAQGDSVHVAFLADGVTSRGTEDGLDQRNEAAENAAKALGAQKPYLLGFPDNKMDGMPLLDIVQKLEELIGDIKPDVIYTHHAGDLNVDHRITHQAVMTACRPMPGTNVQEIYCFEVLSSTEWATPNAANYFIPDYYVDITSTLKAKQAALKCYEAEMRPFPHARSYEAVDALARTRGVHMGVEAAEAFVTARRIWK